MPPARPVVTASHAGPSSSSPGPSRPGPSRPASAGKPRALLPAALGSLLALSACGGEGGDTAALDDSEAEEILGSEPVDDHEPGESPDAITDPAKEAPPLINRTGPDRDEGVEVEIRP